MFLLATNVLIVAVVNDGSIFDSQYHYGQFKILKEKNPRYNRIV